MKVALYLRCSTSEQSTDLQRNELEEFAAHRKMQIIGIYEDYGTGASSEKRPDFVRLIRDAKQAKFDAILVWKLDRFSRSLCDLILTLEELNSASVAFLSLRDALDLTTPQGRLLMGILGSFAQFERELIVSRCKAGVAAYRKRNGGRWGRKPHGQDETILRLRSKGLSLAKIARMTGLSKTTIHRAVHRSDHPE